MEGDSVRNVAQKSFIFHSNTKCVKNTALQVSSSIWKVKVTYLHSMVILSFIEPVLFRGTDTI